MANILIVSNNTDERQLLKLILEKQGHCCIVTENIKEALRCFQSDSVDLMIFKEIQFVKSGNEDLGKIESEMAKRGVLMLRFNGCIYWGGHPIPKFYDLVDVYVDSPPIIGDLLDGIIRILKQYGNLEETQEAI